MNSEKCARCHAYLFENEDDIVYCPTCGAPHHRECYLALGHCALEELHGTEQQYDKTKEAPEKEEHVGENAEGMITCGICREKYELSQNRCPKCGAPNIAKMGGSFASFDFLGGVPEDCDIGDGVTADEAKRFVAVNTRRYIPKFAILNQSNKTSWNWAAFLFPCEWMLSRKMYKNGILVGILLIIATLFGIPLNSILTEQSLSGNLTELTNPQTVFSVLTKSNAFILIFAAVGAFCNLAIRVVLAVFADFIYKGHTLSAIKAMRAESEDMDYDYQRLGGVNTLLFIVGFFAVRYIPIIITSFVSF